jgi:hypothetical protein
MPIPRVLVTRFFQLVTDRRFAEADRTLQRIKIKTHNTEWNKGYFTALQGIILAKKSNDDQYAFLSNMNSNETGELQRHQREFLKQAKSKLQADYDRGFFSAWADYMRVLVKTLKDAERKTANRRTKQPASSKREEEVEKPPQQVASKKPSPKKVVQTKLG